MINFIFTTLKSFKPDSTVPKMSTNYGWVLKIRNIKGCLVWIFFSKCWPCGGCTKGELKGGSKWRPNLFFKLKFSRKVRIPLKTHKDCTSEHKKSIVHCFLNANILFSVFKWEFISRASDWICQIMSKEKGMQDGKFLKLWEVKV